MTQAPISLDASVTAEVGKDSVDKLVDAIVDAFSPATESLGLVGDSIRLARVEVATAIARRAKTIADEHGLRLKAPPLKFLIPFFETVSLEDDESPAIREMWSRLLLSAGTEFSSAHILFARVLKEMTEQEADLFRRLCETSRNGPWEQNWKLEDADVVAKLIDIKRTAVEFVEAKVTLDQWIDAIRARYEQPGLIFLAVAIECESSNFVGHSYTPAALGRKFEDLSFDLLESLGVIKPIFIDGASYGDATIDVEGWYVTSLGGALYRSCVGNLPE